MGTTLQQKHIDEFLLVKESEGMSVSCLSKYTLSMKQFKIWLGDEEITKLKLIEYLGYLRNKGLADWSQKTNAQILKTCIRYLISAGYDFPKPDYKMPRIHKKKLCYLETDQMKKLIKSDLYPRELLVVRLLISTGLRLHELCMLDWSDINFKTGAIQVRYAKGDKFRFVVTDKPTLVLLMKYKNKNDITDMDLPVICTDEDSRFTKYGMRSLINRIREKTGIFFTCHALRRTFARQAVLNGMDIIWVQQLMGHSSIEMTRSYVGQLDTSDLINAYNKHSPIGI